MTRHKQMLRRLLLFEVCLAVLGLLSVSALFIYSIGQQQKIMEDLFQHPFTVSNAGLEFRSDVLEFRKFMLEAILTRKRLDDISLARIQHFEDQMDRHLLIIRSEFLGDRNRVNDLMREMEIWKLIRVPIKASLMAGNSNVAMQLAMNQATPHIEQILVDTDYVISFARSRAVRYVEEGRTKLDRSRLLLAILAVLSLGTYVLLTNKLRRMILKIYDREEHNATFDVLCKAYNRRSFINLFEIEIKKSQRHGHNLSVLMLDLDHFKNVNDTHGHDIGDHVLSEFCVVCCQHLRGEDILGRVGGEEFALLLPSTGIDEALLIAERIRQEVATWDFKLSEGKVLKVTVSIGISSLNDKIDTVYSLLKSADNAMYRSKKEGRNRVTPCLSTVYEA